MSPLAALRGCGTDRAIISCRCPATADVVTTDAELQSQACTPPEQDAGCTTVSEGVTTGPLPPELER